MTMQSSFRDFFPPHVVTFTSDRSADFIFKRGQRLFNVDIFANLKMALSPYRGRRVCFWRGSWGSGFPEVLTIRQVHGKRIVVAARNAAKRSVALEDADGILTDRRGLAIAVRTADCLSVFLYDPRNEVIGLLHAGWRGTQQQISARAVALMRKQWDSNPEDLRVAFGPAIRSCCYRVGASFLNIFQRKRSNAKKDIFRFAAGQQKSTGGGGSGCREHYGLRRVHVLRCHVFFPQTATRIRGQNDLCRDAETAPTLG